MQKTTKGAIAAGAAALLLAAGAGTYATWQATAPETSGAQVTTGHLRVTQVDGSAEWTWATPGIEGEFDPANDTLAPGDAIRFTGQYTLDIEGSNLDAALIATTGATGSGETEALPAGLSWTPDAGNNLTGLNETDDDGRVVTVGGTLEFAGSATGAMDQTISINNITVTLTQTSPGVAQ